MFLILICKLYNRLTFSVMEEQYPTLVVYGVCFMVCVHVAALVSFFIAINTDIMQLPKIDSLVVFNFR